VRTITNADLTGSMGRVKAAGDNVSMESFSTPLQKNVLNHSALRVSRRRRCPAWDGTIASAPGRPFRGSCL